MLLTQQTHNHNHTHHQPPLVTTTENQKKRKRKPLPRTTKTHQPQNPFNHQPPLGKTKKEKTHQTQPIQPPLQPQQPLPLSPPPKTTTPNHQNCNQITNPQLHHHHHPRKEKRKKQKSIRRTKPHRSTDRTTVNPIRTQPNYHKRTRERREGQDRVRKLTSIEREKGRGQA